MPDAPLENRSTRIEKNEIDTGNENGFIDSISLHSVFSDAIEPHLFFSLEGQILEINHAASLFLGIKCERAQSYSIFEFLPSDEEMLLREILEDILEVRNGVLSIQLRVKDFGQLAGEMIYQVVESDIGSIVYARIHDLQIVRSLVRLLQEKELSFKGAERLANLGSWEFFPTEGLVLWSEEIFNIFGLEGTKKAPTFDEYLRMIYPDDVENFSQTVQLAIQNHQSYVIKHRLIRPDGTIRWISGRGDVLLDEEGNLEKVFGTVQDITEEEEFREKIRKSEQRIRFHLDRSPLGYIEWNLEKQVVEWNESAERIFGYSKQEALAGLADIIPESELEHVGQIFVDLLSDTGGTHSVNVNLTKSGLPITVEWFNTTLKGENGDIIGIGSIVKDITERIEANKRLESYAHDLEIARDEAESAAKAKSEFLANMSHEIRTPMNGVIGMASILLDTDLDEEQQDFVETIVSSGESLLAIINDILDLSKIDAGKVDLESLPFSVREIVENTFDLLAAKAAEKKLEMIHFVSQDVPEMVIGDPTRVQQILLNLMGNAIKFTESGYIEVRIGASEVDFNTTLLTFEVEDTGIGIAMEKQSRLFDAFSQVDASISRKYGGTGLGLSISAQLTQMMGGEISVQSIEGIGSTFTFSIKVGIHERKNKSKTDLKGLNVLLVEPNARMQEMIGSFLDELNCRWTSVTSEEEIEEAIYRVYDFDVVLLESCVEQVVLSNLAEQTWEGGDALPKIIVLSWVTNMHGNKQMNQCEYLTKPVHVKNLYRTLKKVHVLQKYNH